MGNVMNRYCYIIACCAALYTATSLVKEPSPIKRETSHTLTLVMAPYEKMQARPELKHEIKVELFQDPFYLSRKFIAEKFERSTDPRGVYVIYAGYDSVINFDRKAWFPFIGTGEQSGKEFTLIVTRQIKPAPMTLSDNIGNGNDEKDLASSALVINTVRYFVRTSDDAAYYSMKRVFDQKENLHYWDVKKLETPANKIIPSYAIVIFADPDQVFVPLEPTVAIPGPNIVLPTLYGTKLLEKDYNALSFVKISKYFDPVQEAIKIAPPQRYGAKIKP